MPKQDKRGMRPRRINERQSESRQQSVCRRQRFRLHLAATQPPLPPLHPSEIQGERERHLREKPVSSSWIESSPLFSEGTWRETQRECDCPPAELPLALSGRSARPSGRR